jgi:hypothetical protein
MCWLNSSSSSFFGWLFALPPSLPLSLLHCTFTLSSVGTDIDNDDIDNAHGPGMCVRPSVQKPGNPSDHPHPHPPPHTKVECRLDHFGSVAIRCRGRYTGRQASKQAWRARCGHEYEYECECETGTLVLSQGSTSCVSGSGWQS